MGIYWCGLCLKTPNHGSKVGWNVCATIERSGFDSHSGRLSVIMVYMTWCCWWFYHRQGSLFESQPVLSHLPETSVYIKLDMYYK